MSEIKLSFWGEGFKVRLLQKKIVRKKIAEIDSFFEGLNHDDEDDDDDVRLEQKFWTWTGLEPTTRRSFRLIFFLHWVLVMLDATLQ